MLLACTDGGQTRSVSEATTTPGFYSGSETAPLVVTEFSDFGCPFCGYFSLFTYPVLHEEFVATGKVRWYQVPTTLGDFPNAARATMAAYCMGFQNEEWFWAAGQALYAVRARWSSVDDPDPFVSMLALEVSKTNPVRGVTFDTKRFASCMDRSLPKALIEAGNELAVDSKVRGTPTFLIGHEQFSGSASPDTFRVRLRKHLELIDAVRQAP